MTKKHSNPRKHNNPMFYELFDELKKYYDDERFFELVSDEKNHDFLSPEVLAEFQELLALNPNVAKKSKQNYAHILSDFNEIVDDSLSGKMEREMSDREI